LRRRWGWWGPSAGVRERRLCRNHLAMRKRVEYRRDVLGIDDIGTREGKGWRGNSRGRDRERVRRSGGGRGSVARRDSRSSGVDFDSLLFTTVRVCRRVLAGGLSFTRDSIFRNGDGPISSPDDARGVRRDGGPISFPCGFRGAWCRL
jgi:hypothetical protein